MKQQYLIPLALALLAPAAQAQQIRSEYIDWGKTGPEFPSAVKNWTKGQKWSADDNFFISRVRPKQRFRNTATQVNPALNEENDKKLIFWVPINNEYFNALPDGVYDSEVFPMWSYVTHYGNWSTRLIRIPGNFADVAHKNGVPVSVVAGIPYGNITSEWETALNTLVKEAGSEKVADYLEYYGVDGIGYNSEFSGSAQLVADLGDFHAQLVKILKGSGRMPLTEFIWYDGTNESGQIYFDRGLGTHNDDIWGYGDDIKTSLFFNYNWNDPSLLETSVATATQVGRTPLDLYCGINMQGREPHNGRPTIWPYLQTYPLSIGLWGAHSQNMFFESRAEKGPDPDARQRSYLLRMEKWFTSGTRNPVNDIEVSNSLKLGADNDDFFGMSKLMSARSALKWDLAEEPFITYFNLGNGKFFNFEGERRHNSEWYNIGVQDYLPTWMWWFSGKFLGRSTADLVSGGLSAEYVWDDAWLGGSLIRVHGSSAGEYLHLFKTEFALAEGDVITVRFKKLNGKADISLALSAKGNEGTPLGENELVLTSESDKAGKWIEKKFTVGKDIASLAGKELAMVALRFKNAADLDMRLGEFSIVRPGKVSEAPETPVIEYAEILNANHKGTDAKVIFNMPNDKGNDVCYNSDVNVSLFKLYAQQKGKKETLMGVTTSWAGLLFTAPMARDGEDYVRVGVSALSPDMTAESEIAWSDYMPIEGKYEISDDIDLDRKVLNPGEPFTISYLDPRHPAADWTLTDKNGTTVASAKNRTSLSLPAGLKECGHYSLKINGTVHSGETPSEAELTYPAFVQVSSAENGSLPLFTEFKVNGNEKDIFFPDAASAKVSIDYKATTGEAQLSRGVRLGRSGMGFRYDDSPLEVDKSFSISFWVKPDNFENNAAHALNIRDKEDKWANNNWGWFWHTINPDGTFAEFTMRMNTGGNISYKFADTRVTPGMWHHFAYIFHRDESARIKCDFYLDGEKQTITSWFKGDTELTTTPNFRGRTYTWRKNNVVSVGGFLHNSGSLLGNLDNFMVWNTALDEEGVRLAMSDIQADNMPENLVGFFDFETDPDGNRTFSSVGNSDFKAGTHDYLATEVEGQGTIYWTEPEYCPGSPFVSGKAFNLKTTAQLITSGADAVTSEITPSAGSASLEFPKDGLYEVGVALTNELGTTEKSVKIAIGEASEIRGLSDETVKPEATPSPFTSFIDVKAPEAGRYDVMLFDTYGRCMISNSFTASEGETMRIFPDVEPGIYLLTLVKDGAPAGSLKVIRK